MRIYLDESGDLGWKFDAPYQKGGSSRYLVLAFLFLPEKTYRYSKKIITKLYKNLGWLTEKKASETTLSQKLVFCQDVAKLLDQHPEIKIDAIIANKINVQPHIRNDSNKLYNYMTGLVIPNYVGTEETVTFIPDKRSIKVESGNSLGDYLQIKLWFDYGYKTKLICQPQESHTVYNLQFADWLSNCIFINFENSIKEPFNRLQPYINIRRLYF